MDPMVGGMRIRKVFVASGGRDAWLRVAGELPGVEVIESPLIEQGQYQLLTDQPYVDYVPPMDIGEWAKLVFNSPAPK